MGKKRRKKLVHVENSKYHVTMLKGLQQRCTTMLPFYNPIVKTMFGSMYTACLKDPPLTPPTHSAVKERQIAQQPRGHETLVESETWREQVKSTKWPSGSCMVYYKQWQQNNNTTTMMYSNKWSTFHGTFMSVTTNKQTAIYINLLAPLLDRELTEWLCPWALSDHLVTI